jgi:hypothetical protein
LFQQLSVADHYRCFGGQRMMTVHCIADVLSTASIAGSTPEKHAQMAVMGRDVFMPKLVTAVCLLAGTTSAADMQLAVAAAGRHSWPV